MTPAPPVPDALCDTCGMPIRYHDEAQLETCDDAFVCPVCKAPMGEHDVETLEACLRFLEAFEAALALETARDDQRRAAIVEWQTLHRN